MFFETMWSRILLIAVLLGCALAQTPYNKHSNKSFNRKLQQNVAATSQFDSWAQQVSPDGTALANLIDSLHVNTNWAKGSHVAWFSGKINDPGSTVGVSTHCSAFAAAVAERLGVPLLRPPNHGQVLLATPQQAWIKGPGAQFGWRVASGPVEAQAAANRGMFAVVSKANPNPSSPGHIAVVRPNAAPNLAFLQANGPQVAQSGSINSPNITANQGFRPLNTPYVIYAIYDRQASVPDMPTTKYISSINPTDIYLLDQAPAGRLDTYKLTYTTKGAPTWTLSAGGIALSNSSAWSAWYQYTLKDSTRNEPYTSKRNGYVEIRPQDLWLNDNGKAVTLNAVGGPQVSGLTGLWYADLDGLIYGMFITNSNSTHVTGYVMGYGSSGAAEWQEFIGQWQGFTNTGGNAIGFLRKCTKKRATAAVPTCVQSTTNSVGITFSTVETNRVASLSGYPGVSENIQLQKATVFQPYLGPVV